MKFSLAGDDWRIIEKLVVEPLKRDLDSKIWVFGSRARGDSREFSDLDILYEPKKEIPKGYISKLRDSLEESRLSVKVDLVQISELADSYREQVFKERIPLN